MGSIKNIGIVAGLAGVGLLGWRVLSGAEEPVTLTELVPESSVDSAVGHQPTEELEDTTRVLVPRELAAEETDEPEVLEGEEASPLEKVGGRASVTARFLDSADQPVAGVEFRLVTHDRREHGSTRSDGTGTARISVELMSRDNRQYWAWWMADDLASGEQSLVLGPDDDRHLGDILLASGAVVEGRVTDLNGAPRADVLVWWQAGDLSGHEELRLQRFGTQARKGGGRLSANASSSAVLTDALGRYSLSGVPIKIGHVWAGASESRFTWSPPLALIQGELRQGVDLILQALQPEDQICGRVVDLDGNAVPEASLSYHFNAPDLSGTGGAPVRADGSFQFLVQRNVPHEFRARVHDASISPATAAGVLPGTLDLVLTLGEEPAVTLLVQDREGDPVEMLTISCYRITESGTYGTGSGTRTYPGGEVMVPAEKGTFSIGVKADGFAPARAGPFENGVVPKNHINLVLERVPSLRGVVLAGGVPVEGAVVSLHGVVTGDQWLKVNGYLSRVRSGGGAARTDSNGRFELLPDELGLHHLRVDPPQSTEATREWAGAELLDVKIAVRVEPAELTLELQRAGTLVVQVRREDGGDPGGTLVSLNRYDGAPRVVAANAEGVVRVPGLMPGGWAIDVARRELPGSGSSSSAGSGATVEWPIDCTLFAGQVTHFELVVEAE
jgi:hypothetical protein